MKLTNTQRKRIEKWVVLLRSGKYKQGRHRLRQETVAGETLFCCLGVLTDLCIKDTKKFGWGGTERIDNCSYPPHAIYKYSGLEFASFEYLIHYNDVAKKSFSEIADIIENEYLKEKE